MADVLPRRRPACGSELEHRAHEFTDDYRADGTVLGPRDAAWWCTGWTAAEADLCVMLRDVQVAMAEKNPPDGSKKWRVEASPMVVNGLQGLFLPEPAGRVDVLFGAVLVPMPMPAGAWVLVQVLPPVLTGTVRP